MMTMNRARWWLLAMAILLLQAGCASRESLSYERVLEDVTPKGGKWNVVQRQPRPIAEETPEPAELALTGPLTLERAIELALERNPDYRSTFAGIRQAEAMLAESRAAFRPRVTADLGYYLGDAAAPAFVKLVDGRVFSPEVDVNDPGMQEFFETAIDVAMARRPELEQARLQVEHAAIGLDSQRAGQRPRLESGVRAYLTEEDNPGFDAGDTNWWAQLNLSWNVFDGGVRRARVEQARAMLDRSILADRKTTLAIQLDVKTAYLRIAEARARLEVAEAAVRHAEESLELVRTRYDAGAATVIRYLNAEQMRTEARMGRTQAIFDLRKSSADGARAIGLFAVELDGGGESDDE